MSIRTARRGLTPPPPAVGCPRLTSGRAGHVCCAAFPPLRAFALCCAPSPRTAKGKVAQQSRASGGTGALMRITHLAASNWRNFKAAEGDGRPRSGADRLGGRQRPHRPRRSRGAAQGRAESSMTAGPRVLHALLNECAHEHRYLLTGKVPERDRRRGPRQPRSVPRAPAGRGATAPARRRSWSRSKGPSGAGRNPFLVEMCISLSRTPVGTALSLSHWARRPVGPDRRGARAGSLVDAGPAARSPGRRRARHLTREHVT